MKVILIATLLCGMSMSLPALADDDTPIYASQQKITGLQFQRPYWAIQIAIQSKVDTITITSIVANKGNCDSGPQWSSPLLPVTLAFGQEVDTSVGHCNVLQLDVDTSLGSYTFDFDPQ